MSVKLSNAALKELNGGIAVPKYNRGELSAGVVHFGVGNFHRAHQAVYLDDLFGSGRDHDWAIIGAGVRDADAIVREKLGQQDWLTTVAIRKTGQTRTTGEILLLHLLLPHDHTS